jgi:hypothetical protein
MRRRCCRTTRCSGRRVRATAEREIVRQTGPPVIDVAEMEPGNTLLKGNGAILENTSEFVARDHRRLGERAQLEMREYRLASYRAFVLCVGLTLASSGSLAQEQSRRIDVGLAVRYMPTGWFEWSGRSGATESALGAYPALGGALFVDYRLNPALSVGFMPEFTLNVIPRTMYYPVSAMTAGSLRVKVEYPGLSVLAPYVLFAPGYSSIFAYNNTGGSSGDAHGFVLSAYAGLRIPTGTRHSVFAEGGYLHGFQKSDGHRYAPSYVVLAAGWQMSL